MDSSLLVQQEESDSSSGYWTLAAGMYAIAKNVVGLSAAIEILRTVAVMVLTANRDLLVSYESMIIPVLSSAWYGSQFMFLKGFCFYYVIFEYTKYSADARTMLQNCDAKAYDEMIIAASSKAAETSYYKVTYDQETIDLYKDNAFSLF